MMFGIISQVAKQYFQNRPLMPLSHYNEDVYWYDDTLDSNYDPSGELELIYEELADDSNAWARSEEDGWYYED